MMGNLDLGKVFSQRPLHGEQEQKDKEIREHAMRLADTIQNFCPDSRERSVALTNVQQAVLWAHASFGNEEF